MLVPRLTSFRLHLLDVSFVLPQLWKVLLGAELQRDFNCFSRAVIFVLLLKLGRNLDCFCIWAISVFSIQSPDSIRSPGIAIHDSELNLQGPEQLILFKTDWQFVIHEGSRVSERFHTRVWVIQQSVNENVEDKHHESWQTHWEASSTMSSQGCFSVKVKEFVRCCKRVLV